MKTVWSSTFAALALAATMSIGAAARGDILFFSEVGQPVPITPGDEATRYIASPPVAPMAIPNLTLEVGEEKTLSIWMDMDGAAHNYDGLSWDIESSNPGVLSVTNQTLFNMTSDFTGTTRWQNTIAGQVGAAGEANLVTNTRIYKVQAAGIGNTAATNFDTGRDQTTASFYLGTVTFEATGSGTAGLYFRNGEFRSALNTGAAASIQYGGTGAVHSGAVIGAGDPIDAGLTMADAIFTVQGGPVRTDVVIVGGDPTGGTDIPFAGVQPVAVEIGGPAGKIVVDPGFSRGGFFDVFFDVEFGGGASTDLDGLIAMLESQSLDVRDGADLPTGPNRELENYDFSLRMPAPVGGEDLVLDFDFAANGVTGVSVNQVAVPEPSSIAIAALGLVAVFGLRRRKA
jgi:hypothetical protein